MTIQLQRNLLERARPMAVGITAELHFGAEFVLAFARAELVSHFGSHRLASVRNFTIANMDAMTFTDLMLLQCCFGKSR
ncbi:MAG: hypothetical protein DKINENOH_04730 [bacterium]|nr:hypothetical protein [bacterium]